MIGGRKNRQKDSEEEVHLRKTSRCTSTGGPRSPGLKPPTEGWGRLTLQLPNPALFTRLAIAYGLSLLPLLVFNTGVEGVPSADRAAVAAAVAVSHPVALISAVTPPLAPLTPPALTPALVPAFTLNTETCAWLQLSAFAKLSTREDLSFGPKDETAFSIKVTVKKRPCGPLLALTSG